MGYNSSVKRVISILAIVFIFVSLLAASSFSDPVASLSIQADPVQPAGLPILLHLSITNTGSDPLSYYAFNFAPIPASYPDARLFTVTVTDSQGRITRIGPRTIVVSAGKGLRVQQQDTPYEICNGQTLYFAFSGHIFSLQQGQSLTVPIALSALPPGSYTFSAESSEQADVAEGIRYVTWPMMQTLQPAPVAIAENPSLSRLRLADFLDGTLHQDMSALADVSEFKVQPVVDVLVSDLTSPDLAVALSAAKAINLLRPVPDNIGESVYQSVTMNLDPDEPLGNFELLRQLVTLSRSLKGDKRLQTIEMVALSRKDPILRCDAIKMLKSDKPEQQERIGSDLHRLLTDPDSNVRGAAAVMLANRHDPIALPILLSLIHLPNPYQNFLYTALAKFPNDPSVESAIRTGLKDTDDWSRPQAQEALDMLTVAGRNK
jgi:hypothetical protein